MKKTNILFLALVLSALSVTLSCSKNSAPAQTTADPLKTLSSLIEDLPKVTSSAETPPSSSSSSSSSSVSWDKALDEYEQFVDEYVAFMKKYKENPANLGLITDYAAMTQKTVTMADTISNVEKDLSGDELIKFSQRYTKILEKMASVL